MKVVYYHIVCLPCVLVCLQPGSKFKQLSLHARSVQFGIPMQGVWNSQAYRSLRSELKDLWNLIAIGITFAV